MKKPSSASRHPSEIAVIEKVRAALHSESRVRFEHHSIRLDYADGDLTMEGEVPDIAGKKLALERAAAVEGVHHIVDRLRVRPAERMADGQIRDLMRDALLQEPAFLDCAIGEWVKGQLIVSRVPATPSGTINIRVSDGVVTLEGNVNGLSRKRLAGVLAWWVPGSRDVVNGLGVVPPQDDNDGEITDAVRIALEKDPFVNAGQIRVGTHQSVVTLTGLVPTDAEREAAEFDAWYVFAVDRVINKIQVRR